MNTRDQNPQQNDDLGRLEAAVASGEAQEMRTDAVGPPPLRTFGLVLHHDGSWSHEGIPFRNRRLIEKFDRSVRYLPGEGGVHVVQVGHFRGLIEVEEAAFFVREVDLDTGKVRLSDGSEESLEIAGLSTSQRDGALLCRVKRDLEPAGLPARFSHSAQAEFMNAVDESGAAVAISGSLIPLPELEA
jgi:hypothetical protein